MKEVGHNQCESKRIIICDECQYEFSLDVIGIQSASVKIKNHTLELSYFMCPKCNKVYKILLQDDYYKKLEKDLDLMKVRICKHHGKKNEEVLRILDSMIRKKFNRLKNYESKLNKVFSGSFVAVHEDEGKVIKYLP